MREGLREVAQQPLGTRVVLLAKKPHIVLEREQLFEVVLSLLNAPRLSKSGNQPERADEKGSLAAGQPIHTLVS